MSKMFDNYNNLSTSYIPNNQKITDTFNRIEFNNKEPRKEFSNDGLFIGYSWNYGDTVEIPYSIYKTIPVEDNAIIYYESEKGPSKDTVGLLNQKAYNIVDLKLWICKTLDQSIYNWVEQDKFTYPTHGKKMVTLNSDIDMSDKSIEVNICNFRKEVIYTETFSGQTSVKVNIDKDLSKKLLKGIYYITFSIVGENYKNLDESLFILIKDETVAYDLSEASGSPQNNLYDTIIDVVKDYLNHHSDELFNSEFNSESNLGLQNKVITNEIFGDNGIYAIIETLSSWVQEDTSIENKLINESYLQKQLENYKSISKTSELENDGSDGQHPFITLQDIPTNYATKDYVNDAIKDCQPVTKTSELTNNGDGRSPFVTESTLSDNYASKDWVNKTIAANSNTSTELTTSFNALSSINSDSTAITPKGAHIISDKLNEGININGVSYDSVTECLKAIAELLNNTYRNNA